jgi:hypothetical protein
MLSDCAVSWKSSRQDCVSLSTSEADYVAASECGQGVVYLREILRDFGFPYGILHVSMRIILLVWLCRKTPSNASTRHIDIRRYFVRDLVAQQVLKLVPLRTNLMILVISGAFIIILLHNHSINIK